MFDENRKDTEEHKRLVALFNTKIKISDLNGDKNEKK